MLGGSGRLRSPAKIDRGEDWLLEACVEALPARGFAYVDLAVGAAEERPAPTCHTMRAQVGDCSHSTAAGERSARPSRSPTSEWRGRSGSFTAPGRVESRRFRP